MYKTKGILLIALVAITGCSHSPFNKENRFSLDGYEDAFFAECMSRESLIKKSTISKESSCRDIGHALMTTAQKGFEENRAEKVAADCKGEEDFNQCVYAAQKSHYDAWIPVMIEKVYPDSKQ